MKEVKVFDALKLLGFSEITNDGASINGEMYWYGIGTMELESNTVLNEDRFLLCVKRGPTTPVIRLLPTSMGLEVSRTTKILDIYHISMGTNEMSLEEKIIFMKLLGD